MENAVVFAKIRQEANSWNFSSAHWRKNTTKAKFLNTINLPGLEQIWNHEYMFEALVVRGDSKENTQYTIFNINMKITQNYPKSAVMGFIPRNSRTSLKQRWWTSHQCSSHWRSTVKYATSTTASVWLRQISAFNLTWGRSGGAMVLGKLSVPGRPTVWITVGQGPTALAIGAGGGCLDIFTLIYPFSPFSPSLWETARYRLKYCLKGPLNPKQPTNQSF